MTEEGSRRQGSGSGEMAHGVEVGRSFSIAIMRKGIRHTWPTTVTALRPPVHAQAAVAHA
jgi:hypothetical protein